MKIKYNTPSDMFKFIEDSYFIVAYKKKILKNKKYPFHNSIKRNLISFVGYILLLITMILFYVKTGAVFGKIMIYIITFCILALGFAFFNLAYTYFKTKNKDINGVVIIDKEGITDEDNDTKVLVKWEHISCMIIGKWAINIFVKNRNIYFRLPVDIKKKLVDGIMKYSDIEIIDLIIND